MMMKKLVLILFVILFSLSNCQEITVDPWIFQERVSLFDNLLEIHLPLVFGESNENNCLYGLPLQLNWQNRSGRLNGAMTNGKYRIDEYSWWADMNYYLSVIPYLAAMELNMVPQVNIVPPRFMNASLFCLTYEKCNKTVMDNWVNYFRLLRNLQQGQQNNSGTVEEMNKQLLEIMWIAHTGSINHALMTFNTQLNLYNVKESKFGFGWANFVEILSIINFNTNYTQVSAMEIALPFRLLKWYDFPPLISDLPEPQQVIVSTMFDIADVSKTIFWEPFLDSLRNIVKNPRCQEMLNRQLQAFVYHPVNTLLFILKDIILSCPQ
ncbi:DUF781 family protein [Tieghemostelium lacteum]|uniref:DUF781 family protein n=1 Tax=Tieghemostelium lacteum TaxID=361077 RepID=A0A151ZBU2_TIELA|nr:DUF781 family protein [Tieghemostelium lacteum]|eukprot:KYQ91408.1 DUF781 family protein [Tieghemostelium lacteum]